MGEAGKRWDEHAGGKVQALTGIGTVEVSGSWLIRIRTLREFLPSKGFHVEHIDVGNHPPFCDEATSLEEEK